MRSKSLLFLLALVLPASAARATVLRGLDLDALCARSEHVVRARVLRTRSEWRNRRIVTRVTVRVERSLHGASRAGSELSFWRLGGRVGRFEQLVSGAPTFRANERVVVFLSRRAGKLFVTGMAQGKFPVVQARAGRSATVYPARYRGPLLGGRRALTKPVTIEAFERRVRRSLRRLGRRRP